MRSKAMEGNGSGLLPDEAVRQKDSAKVRYLFAGNCGRINTMCNRRTVCPNMLTKEVLVVATYEEVKAQCESTRTKLKEAIAKMEVFLNEYSVNQLNTEADPAMDEFYRGFLQDMRHLLVFSEVSYEKLGNTLRRPQFNQDFAERTLYEVYHNCVTAFFYPKNECYSEDGRYAYTGQDSIRFRKKPSRETRNLTIEMTKVFEELREDLAYYESDYIMNKRMKGERF